MDSLEDTLELRYVGVRFNGARIPLDVLPDLSAVRDLVIALAKARWLKAHPERQRLPRGFNHSVAFDLIAIKEGSARPQLKWDRQGATEKAPDLVDEIGRLLAVSYNDAANLFLRAATGRLATNLPADQLNALNRFGVSLRSDEKIEFVNQNDDNGDVIYIDLERRKRLLTSFGEEYPSNYRSSGVLVTSSSSGSGYIEVETTDHGVLKIQVPADIVVKHYDGNMGSEVQFDLVLILDGNDNIRRVENCLDVTIVESSDTPEFIAAMSAINEFRSLKAGWLDGNGEAISSTAVRTARKILRQRSDIAQRRLGVFPTESGGITFEFRVNLWDHTIEIYTDGSVELLGIETAGNKEFAGLTFADANQQFWFELESKIGKLQKNGS